MLEAVFGLKKGVAMERWLEILTTAAMLCLSGACMAAERVDNSTLHQKVMCGYQGWFRAPGDGFSSQWIHYQHPNESFQDGDCCIDYWPDMSEMADDEKYATPFRYKDGSAACVFSSVNRKTILRHFKWMQDYGIDGIFLQRFATVISSVVRC